MGSHTFSRSALDGDSRAILEAIRQIVRALRISSKLAERTSQISSAQLFVLQKLKAGESISLNELAERTLTHQSSASVVVSKLSRQGLVQRKKSKLDRRGLEISITPAGLALLKKAPEPFQERLVESINRMPKAMRTQVARGLKDIVRGAELPGGPAPLFFEEKPKRSKQHDRT